MNPTILPNYYLDGFDGTNLSELVDKGHIGGSTLSLEEALEGDHSPQAPHFVQYALVRTSGEQLPICPRLNMDCLPYFGRDESVVDVRMAFVMVDMDLNAHREWKPREFRDWYFKTVAEYPVLDRGVVYSSPHGCKAIWRLSHPLVPSNEGWDAFYRKFAEQLNGFGPSGEGVDTQRSPWVSTFRVPRGSDYIAEDVMYGSRYREGLILTDAEIDLALGVTEIATSVVSVTMTSNGAPVVDDGPPDRTNILELKTALTVARQLDEKAVEEFRNLALYKWCVNHASLICYKTWWYMGTNIFAVTKGGDKGRALWHEFSQHDASRYNPQECDRQYDEMGRYFGRGKGPVTYKKFRDMIGDQKWTLIYNNAGPSPSSSPAGRANKNSRRRLPALVQQSKDAEEGPLPPDKVWGLLATREIGPKGEKVTVINKSRIDNLETILRLDEHFHGRLRCDLLGAVDRWDHPQDGEKTANDPDCFTDARSYISKQYGIDFGDLETRKWFTAASYKSAYHPVQDYLYTLTWDGEDRIDDLIECLSCEVNDYTRLIVRKWLISTVVRPLQLQTAHVRDYTYLEDGRRKPMKVDNTLVLMGKQGSGDWGGKTAFFETMAVRPEWYTDFLPSITRNRKDAALTVLDSWIVEMGEVDDYKSKNDEGTMKRFLSSQREKFRRPYDAGNKSWWRGCVFVGTTNKTQFLNDPTGDRRYWVLPVGQTVDVPRIQAIRDQLWAQAVYYFESGEVWWLMGAERELQERKNTEFRCLDATEEYIREWLAAKDPKYVDTDGKFGPKSAIYSGGITPLEIAQGALGKLLGDANNADLQRIGMTMHNLGYKKVRKTVDGIAKKIYIKT